MIRSQKAVFPARAVASVPPQVSGPFSGVDRAALSLALSAISDRDDLPDTDRRSRALDLFKETLEAARLSAREQFEMGRLGGLEMARLWANLHSDIVCTLFDYAKAQHFQEDDAKPFEGLALLAVGGFGRGEMAPQSDLDLLFLHAEKSPSAAAESTTEYVLYMLWDMGLKVGHASRRIEDCLKLSKEDQTILTALLDMRFLAGDKALSDSLHTAFRKHLNKTKGRDYIRMKLEERDARHERGGNSRYVIEPNVKEGKGGLRDLHVLYWIARFLDRDGAINDPQRAQDYVTMGLFDELAARRFTRAADFLWRARIHLHLLSERNGEVLHFDKQIKLARKMGYAAGDTVDAVEKFMREYFLNAREVGALTRIACAKLEAENALTLPRGLDRLLPRGRGKVSHPDFILDHGRLNFRDPLQIKQRPKLIMELFLEAGRRNNDIHPDAFAAIAFRRNVIDNAFRKDPEISQIFQDILLTAKAPGMTMKIMNEADVLGRYLLEFGGIVARTQFNMHHAYTVDEHTLRLTVGFHDLWKGNLEKECPLASSIVPTFSREQMLTVYMATLLHDTGKGKGDQCIEGAQLSRKACKRMGLSKDIIETTSWLVRRHLDMSETAQRRDVSDPQTVETFAALVGSVERLDMLLALTVVDIRAVGPGIWNDWKAELLRQLYNNTLAVLEDVKSLAPQARARASRESLQERLSDNMNAQVLPELDRWGQDYWLGFDLTDRVRHARWLSGFQGAIPQTGVKVRMNKPHDITELWVLTDDRDMLFSDLTRAISASGASITGARLSTGESGRVFDVFYLQNVEGLAFGRESPPQIERLIDRTHRAARGEKTDYTVPKPQGSQRADAIPVAAKVSFSDASKSGIFVIDVSGRDRPGLLHELARTLSEHNLTILSAHVEVVGPEAIDAFYVRPHTGDNNNENLALSPKALSAVKEDLLSVLKSKGPAA